MGDFKHRMSHAVHPLVKEPVKPHTAGFFHRPPEVAGFDVLELVPLQVVPDAFAPGFVADDKPQHVEHQRAA